MTQISASQEEEIAARVALNIGLAQVALSTQQHCSHAEAFQSTVSVEQVTDYLAHVAPLAATTCLDSILSRTRCCYYTSINSFRRDYEQILANALAYNRRGRLAVPAMIGWAQELLDVCCTEILARRSELQAAERKLKGAGRDMSQDVSPRKSETTTGSDTSASLEALVAACEFASAQAGFNQEDDVPGSMLQSHVSLRYKRHTEPSLHHDMEPSCQLQRPPAKRMSHPSGVLQRTVSAGGGKMSSGFASAYETGPKYRRHKSRVFIRPNKVVYLPTTFMEENFDAASLPVNCEMLVEINGEVQPDRHTVTIKAVPRNGLSTMYCMTNVMKFQTEYLNWQILNWTKVDENHIKIHLHGPSTNIKGSTAGMPEAEDCMWTERDHANLKCMSNLGEHSLRDDLAFVNGQVNEVGMEDCNEVYLTSALHHHQPKLNLGTDAAMLPEEDQVGVTALQEQLNILLKDQQNQKVNFSGSSFQDQDLDQALNHLQNQQLFLPPRGQSVSPIISQTLDMMKVLQQQQQVQQTLFNSHLPSLSLWGLQSGCTDSGIDELLHSLGEDQHRLPHFPLEYPMYNNCDVKHAAQTKAMLFQQLSQGATSGLYSSFIAEGPQSVHNLGIEETGPCKRFKTETASEMLGGLDVSQVSILALQSLLLGGDSQAHTVTNNDNPASASKKNYEGNAVLAGQALFQASALQQAVS